MGICREIINTGTIRFNEPLSNHSTFRIGGNAKVWAEPDTIDDLKILYEFIKKNNLRFFVIGAGSNLLISDEGFSGIVISLGRDFNELKHNKSKVFSGAALPLTKLINYTCSLGLGGLEGLAGIPGLVGGAIATNAGVKSISIGNFIDEVVVLDCEGKTIKLSRKDLKFDYRKTNLSKYIILGAWFSLKERKPPRIKKNITYFLKLRKASQDLKNPSCGCIFKNPKNNFAGKLIEACGLKGKNIGDAFISTKHANFIINKGNAKANDVLGLIDLIRNEVKDKYKIWLEPEIKILN